jgi:uncharacterized membrane protein
MTDDPPPGTDMTGAPRPWASASVRWRVDGTDGHRVLTWLAPLGVVAGMSLAVLGLPTADLHGPLHYLGLMDPLCGATRGVRLAFLGDLPSAWRYNPAAIPLAAGAVFMVARGLLGWVTGRWINAELRWTPTTRTLIGVLIVALWVNQQWNAPLLLTRA